MPLMSDHQLAAELFFFTFAIVYSDCVVTSGDGVGDGVGSGSVGLKTGFSEGFGAALIATPLFQTSLLPDLMQVNFLPPAVEVAPTFVHFAPALGAVAWRGVVKVSKITTATATAIFFLARMIRE